MTITVDSSLSDAPDVNPGDQLCETAVGNGVCTLRAAIMEANAFAGLDEIKLPTLNHALLLPSPAINSGNPSGCGDPLGERLAFDQRGHLRHFDGGIGTPRCDLGASQYLAPEAFRLFLAVIQR